ncbi:hypothetical protein NVP1283C_57 [Vibrio phage 1.283.C._10N.286.55.A1]|nr:hypothetical protein NVP1195O_60 [Vibrio phage 1.195.O._10N.286.54.C8]AUR99823.1 hypothetical protein NVP1269O_60 [Vibrio phage 1.269.O._10N.286.54.A6]AUS01129.1 hypothetical protein NVP1283A_57 [Vibrio phage 1.283.A._10N.286.55.A1]AUS01214.1 hypothetical protein NVP1283B_57 [Vibrio phage 1.283.B._10N.286.55.A1]AUS01299.1 hypothetical protein NVP1283C_57 [Vibrio phage 1.283.C._10N.286.55.A1]
MLVGAQVYAISEHFSISCTQGLLERLNLNSNEFYRVNRFEYFIAKWVSRQLAIKIHLWRTGA